MAQYGFWYSAMAESDTTRGNVVMLPSPNWAGVHKNPTITATGMIMTALTQVPDAAWKLFEWYIGGQPSIDRAKSGWGVPGLKSQSRFNPQETEFQKQANKVLQGELALNDGPIQFNPFLGKLRSRLLYNNTWSRRSTTPSTSTRCWQTLKLKSRRHSGRHEHHHGLVIGLVVWMGGCEHFALTTTPIII